MVIVNQLIKKSKLDALLAPVGFALLAVAQDICPCQGKQQILLFGNIGDDFFVPFTQSPEYNDRQSDPLDRYSRRLLKQLAPLLPTEAVLLMPSDRPYAPFQRWAQQGAYFSSPLGLLIHPQYGLWTAFRGAWRVPINTLQHSALQHDHSKNHATNYDALAASPCVSCEDKPCLNQCPVNAFALDRPLNITACHTHLAQHDSVCLQRQCLARLACPVGQEYQYAPASGSFFLRAFHQLSMVPPQD